MADLSFDDLIPKAPASTKQGLSFDDLVPKPAPRSQGGMGGFRANVQRAFETPTDWQEVGKGGAKNLEELGEQWRQFGIGAAAAIPGTFGDIEALAKLPFKAKGYGAGVDWIPDLPTTEQIPGMLGIEEPSPEMAKERGAGAFAGGLYGPAALEKLLGKGIRSLAGGAPSLRSAKIAEEAEKAGLKVSSGQAREIEPKGKALDQVDQREINRMASAETGKVADSVDQEFVRERFETLGKDYQKAYNRTFKIDEGTANVLKNIIRDEIAVSPAGSSEVAGIADNITRRWESAKQKAAELAAFKMMQGQVSSMRKGERADAWITKRFGPGERIDAPELTPEVMREIGVRGYTNVRSIAAHDAPEWAKGVQSVIEDLTEKLGLRVRPGVYVGEGPGAYGWASPTGHIFINERLMKKPADALATGLHEFGHQAEFQLFKYAPSEIKQGINEAWSRDRSAFLKKKNIEELRPITAEKYNEFTKSFVPKSGEDIKYYLGFQEWFAEQASRYLTTAKAPVTISEKFFKGIADMWRSIYQRVTGHTPLAKEVEDFMKSNWEGKLINEEAVRTIYQTPEKGVAAAAPSAIDPVFGPVIADIPGEELRRLRSAISTKAANATDGNIRYQARQVLHAIDDAIEKSNPKISAKLKELNRKYRATMTLHEMQMGNHGAINTAGHVSPEAVGAFLAKEGRAGYSHPFEKIGRFGTGLKMRSVTQGNEVEADVIRQLIDRSGRVVRYLAAPLAYPMGRARRAVQRMIPGGVPEPVPMRPLTITPATAGKFVPSEEQ